MHFIYREKYQCHGKRTTLFMCRNIKWTEKVTRVQNKEAQIQRNVKFIYSTV